MRAFLLLLLLLTVAPMAARAQDIVIAADEWCPYNCAVDAEKPGFVIDLVKAIYEPLGHRIHYQVMPWSRAIEAASDGDVTAVIGVTKPEAPGLTYPREKLAMSRDGFYTRRDSEWAYKGPGSLNAVTLGVIESYGYDDAINEYINHHKVDMHRVQPVSGNNALIQNVEKLLAGRVDAVIEDENVFKYALMHWRDAKVQIRSAGSTTATPLYIAFSPKLRASKDLADEFDRGMKKLAATGQLKRFMQEYGLDEPRETSK